MGSPRWIRRSAPPVAVALLAVAAWQGGRGISALSAASLGASPAPLALGGHRARGLSTRSPVGSARPAPPDPAPASPEAYAPCEGLRASVIVAASSAEASFAALVPATGGHVIRGPGGRVGARRVEQVAAERVWLSQEGKPPCFAPLSATAAPPAPPAAPRPPEAPAGIARVGPQEFHVDRGLVERALANPADLLRGVVVQLHSEAGRPVGLRVTRVPADSLLGHLGLRAGDVLTTVNGIDLNEPEASLRALAVLRTQSQLQITLRRGSMPLTLDYLLR